MTSRNARAGEDDGPREDLGDREQTHREQPTPFTLLSSPEGAGVCDVNGVCN